MFKKNILLALGILLPLFSFGQFKPKEEKKQEPEALTLGQRFSFRTNTVDWALMTPNFAVGFDLSSSPYHRWSLNLSGRYNWNTQPDTKTYHNYDIREGKLEVRKYYHTRQRTTPYEGLQRYFSPERMNPRYWRAYYWGIYAAYTDFAFKFSRYGYGGDAIHGGISFGMERALFDYKHSNLGLEVGVSAGVAYWDGFKYRLDRENNVYVTEKEYKKVLPVLSEVRVALVYRFGPSVRNRYLYNQEKATQRMERRMEKQKLKAEKETTKKAEETAKKAEKQAKKEAKAAEKAARKEQKLNKKKAAYQEKMERKYGTQDSEGSLKNE